MALATLADLQLRPGGEVVDEVGQDRALVALDDVSAEAVAIAGETWQDITVPAEVVAVVVKATLRYLSNPFGYTSETTGNYTYRTADGGQAEAVYFTAAEAKILTRFTDAGTGGLWNLPLTRNEWPWTGDTIYVPDASGGQSIPMFDPLDLYGT